MEGGNMVKLISCEGEVLTVSEAVAIKSMLIRNMIEGNNKKLNLIEII